MERGARREVWEETTQVKSERRKERRAKVEAGHQARKIVGGRGPGRVSKRKNEEAQRRHLHGPLSLNSRLNDAWEIRITCWSWLGAPEKNESIQNVVDSGDTHCDLGLIARRIETTKQINNPGPAAAPPRIRCCKVAPSRSWNCWAETAGGAVGLPAAAPCFAAKRE